MIFYPFGTIFAVDAMSGFGVDAKSGSLLFTATSKKPLRSCCDSVGPAAHAIAPRGL